MSGEYAPVRDDVNGKMFHPSSVRKCQEPHVIAKYGVGGEANVSVYTCQKCRYKITYDYHGGLGCGFKGRTD